MLRDIRVLPWHMMVPLTLACVLLFTFVPTTIATSAVHAQRLGNGQPLRYLALGDSLATGLTSEPCPSHTSCGYVQGLFPKLQSLQGFTEDKDLGCLLGETSTTFLNGNGNCSKKTPSQLNRALDYIHQGNVGLVTLNIGADDLLSDITLSQQKTIIMVIMVSLSKILFKVLLNNQLYTTNIIHLLMPPLLSALWNVPSVMVVMLSLRILDN